MTALFERFFGTVEEEDATALLAGAGSRESAFAI